MAKSTSKGNRTDAQKKKDLLVALEKNLGIVTYACNAVDVSRALFYKWKKEDKKFAEDVYDINEIVLDFGESQLYTLMKEKNVSAVIFFLKTRGKKRGYTESVDINNGSKATVNINGIPLDAI
jgi:hypothetical protein